MGENMNINPQDLNANAIYMAQKVNEADGSASNDNPEFTAELASVFDDIIQQGGDNAFQNDLITGMEALEDSEISRYLHGENEAGVDFTNFSPENKTNNPLINVMNTFKNQIDTQANGDGLVSTSEVGIISTPKADKAKEDLAQEYNAGSNTGNANMIVNPNHPAQEQSRVSADEPQITLVNTTNDETTQIPSINQEDLAKLPDEIKTAYEDAKTKYDEATAKNSEAQTALAAAQTAYNNTQSALEDAKAKQNEDLEVKYTVKNNDGTTSEQQVKLTQSEASAIKEFKHDETKAKNPIKVSEEKNNGYGNVIYGNYGVSMHDRNGQQTEEYKAYEAILSDSIAAQNNIYGVNNSNLILGLSYDLPAIEKQGDVYFSTDKAGETTCYIPVKDEKGNTTSFKKVPYDAAKQASDSQGDLAQLQNAADQAEQNLNTAKANSTDAQSKMEQAFEALNQADEAAKAAQEAKAEAEAEAQKAKLEQEAIEANVGFTQGLLTAQEAEQKNKDTEEPTRLSEQYRQIEAELLQLAQNGPSEKIENEDGTYTLVFNDGTRMTYDSNNTPLYDTYDPKGAEYSSNIPPTGGPVYESEGDADLDTKTRSEYEKISKEYLADSNKKLDISSLAGDEIAAMFLFGMPQTREELEKISGHKDTNYKSGITFGDDSSIKDAFNKMAQACANGEITKEQYKRAVKQITELDGNHQNTVQGQSFYTYWSEHYLNRYIQK